MSNTDSPNYLLSDAIMHKLNISDTNPMQIMEKNQQLYYEMISPVMIQLITNRGNGTPEHETVCSMIYPSGWYNFSSAVDDSVYRILTNMEQIPQHYHNAFELCYVVSGSMHQMASDQDYYYPAGGACLMAPNTMHTEYYSSDFTAIFITISADYMAKVLDICSEAFMFPIENTIKSNPILEFARHNLRETVPSDKPFLDFVPKISENEQKNIIHSLIERMMIIFLDPQVGSSADFFKELLRLFAILTDEKYYDFDTVSATSRSSLLLFARINQLLDQNYGRISNHELSRILNYNGTYISRIVKKQTGLSLFDYSMKFAMKRAGELLLHSDLSVQEIMDVLNFTNRTHFNQLFQKAFGMKPSEYRKKGLEK